MCAIFIECCESSCSYTYSELHKQRRQQQAASHEPANPLLRHRHMVHLSRNKQILCRDLRRIKRIYRRVYSTFSIVFVDNNRKKAGIINVATVEPFQCSRKRRWPRIKNTGWIHNMRTTTSMYADTLYVCHMCGFGGWNRYVNLRAKGHICVCFYRCQSIFCFDILFTMLCIDIVLAACHCCCSNFHRNGFPSAAATVDAFSANFHPSSM